MNKGLLWGMLLFAGVVAGCALTPSVDALTGDQRAKFDNIKIVRGENFGLYKVLGSVAAYSCQKELSDARLDSEEEAIEKVKLKAALLGADAIVNTTCHNSELGLLSTCWALIECSGDAVQFTDAAH